MKLEKPIKITQIVYNDLIAVKDYMLLQSTNSALCRVVDFKVEEKTYTKTTKHWFGKDTVETTTELYLTEIDLRIWNSIHQWWGTVGEYHIERVVVYYDLVVWKNNYINLYKNAFKELGYKLTKIEENEKTV